MALAEYVKEVRERRFPGEEYTYPIKDDELGAILRASNRWKTASACQFRCEAG